MADEESNYKGEYLDCAEDAPEEERVFTWIARAGKARVTYNSGAVYEGEFNDEKMKHGQGKYTWMAASEEEGAAGEHVGLQPAQEARRGGRRQGKSRRRPLPRAGLHVGLAGPRAARAGGGAACAAAAAPARRRAPPPPRSGCTRARRATARTAAAVPAAAARCAAPSRL